MQHEKDHFACFVRHLFYLPSCRICRKSAQGFPSRVTGRVVDGHYEEYSIYPWSIEYDEESGKMTLLYQVETACM